MNISLLFTCLGFNQTLHYLNLKSHLQWRALFLLLLCVSVQFPTQAWAASSAGAAVSQYNQSSSWRHWFRSNKSKAPSFPSTNTHVTAVGAGTLLNTTSATTTPSLGVGAAKAASAPVTPTPAVAAAVAPKTILSTSAAIATTSVAANLTPLSTTFSAGSAKFSVAMDDVEVLGPFQSWADVKRDYGAKGDGVADDAPALQRAIDDLGMPGKFTVLYLPSGNYKIGSTLRLKWKLGMGYSGVGIVGDAPTTTKITWAGSVGGAMFIQDGSFNTRYSRITWDGKGTAKYGVAHWWNAKGGTNHDGSPEHVDEVYQDMDIGIMGGRMGSNYGQMGSEGQVRRVTFIRNTYAGVDLGSWNALDWWVFDSHFVDCGRGVANTYSLGDNDAHISGAGAIYVYRSLFERSTVADFNIANTGWFSMHENVSQGSRRFFQAEGMGNNGAAIIIKGNRILDTLDPVAISNGNLGPLMLIDNQIRSKLGNSTFAVTQTDWISGRDLFSLGNKYTVANPISLPAGKDRIISVDDTVVAYSAIDGTLPTLPSTPMRLNRKVYEVVPGSNSIQIQAVIDVAVANGDRNAVVHLPSGTKYILDSTLVVPSNTHLQIVGDSLATTLEWRGAANQPMIYLKGPSYATVRDLSLYSHNTVKAIAIDNADQVGGRLFIEGSAPGAITASNLSSTQLTFQANTSFSAISLSNVKSLVAVGNGGVAGFNSTGNSNAFIADTWFEGYESKIYRMDSGTFTYMGGVLAPASHEPAVQPIVPVIELNDFSGKATFVGAELRLRNVPSGVGIHIGTESANTNALFLGIGGNTTTFFSRDNPNGKGGVGLRMSKMPSASGVSTTAPDQGRIDPDFLRAMLAQARVLQWERTIYTPPVGATNVHIYRVFAPQTQGVSISGY